MILVEASSEIRACYERLRERCKSGGASPEAKLLRAGVRNGLPTYDLGSAGVWIAFDESRPDCYQILLGSSPSRERCVVEVNVPREGRSHIFGGMFVRKSDKQVFLARTAGLSARPQWKRFLETSEVPSVELDGLPVALVGDLSSDGLFSELARFVEQFEAFQREASTRPQGNAWRDHLWTIFTERAKALGKEVSLPLYWRGQRADRIEGVLVNDELRVRVTQAIVDGVDGLPKTYADGLRSEKQRQGWLRSASAIRANVGRTVSLNQYGTGYLIPVRTGRSTISMNVYTQFELDPTDAAVAELLEPDERAAIAKALTERGATTLPMDQFGHVLFDDPELEGGDDGPEDGGEEPADDSVWASHRNVIFFGPPGTGKSHQVQEIVTKHLAAAPEHVKRVTFHPEFTYFDFVGSYRPAVGWLKTSSQFFDADGVASDREPRTYYRFEPGPFSHALALAARQKDEPVVLIVEEINRGNCAAIFGDVFQLLDRVNDARRPEREGWSEYAVVPSAEWATWLEAQVPKGSEVFDPKTRQLRLPGNLYLYATMNTSDQSLFPMDTAFRRRWGMSYSGVETHAQPTSRVPLHSGDTDGVQWIALMRTLNREIVDHTRSDDKQMGPWFIRPPAGETTIDRLEFKSKVLYYLWATVFRDRPGRVFHADVGTYEALLARYDKGQHVFQASVLTALGVSEGPPPAPAPVVQG